MYKIKERKWLVEALKSLRKLPFMLPLKLNNRNVGFLLIRGLRPVHHFSPFFIQPSPFNTTSVRPLHTPPSTKEAVDAFLVFVTRR